MARYEGATSTPHDPDNPYYPRHRPRREVPWYRQRWVWIVAIIAIIAIAVWISRGGSVPGAGGGNVTVIKEPTERETLIQFVIAQREAGVVDEEVIQKLRLSGYENPEIQRVLELSDPIVQFIMAELERGVTKPMLVEALLKQGYTPDVIAEKFMIVESTEGDFMDAIAKYWWVLLLLAGGIFWYNQQKDAAAEKRAPKVYTMEECREYAESMLKKKNLDHSPAKEYKNRPELKQYRYVYEEPLYPEFNTHQPWGHQAGQRQYYLLAVGYDKELVDFRLTQKDTDIDDFLYGTPKPFESRGAGEYFRLRERSEQPLQELEERERDTREGEEGYSRQSPYQRRRPYYSRRIRPGPIEGFES